MGSQCHANDKCEHAYLSMNSHLPISAIYLLIYLFKQIDICVSGERPYRCHVTECGRAFIQLSNLQQHLRNHDAQLERAKNRPFQCAICGKGFATESSLRTHTAKVIPSAADFFSSCSCCCCCCCWVSSIDWEHLSYGKEIHSISCVTHHNRNYVARLPISIQRNH